jgi:hypothetical protein
MATAAASFSSNTQSFHPHFTYKLGQSLYIPLTSRCNSRTLPELRGDNFLLPPSVVAALCRVRDVESSTNQWAGWCAYLDTQETYQKLPPSLDYIEKLAEKEHRQPSIQDLFHEIQTQYLSSEAISSFVFSGEGEPLLRFDDMIVLSNQIRDMISMGKKETSEKTIPPSIRLTTNGLVAGQESTTTILQQCIENGISQISVALLTADPDQYEEIMQPLLPSSATMRARDTVCQFIQEATSIGRDGLDVEVTAIDRDDINKKQLEVLVESLGVTEKIRWRPYFP